MKKMASDIHVVVISFLFKKINFMAMYFPLVKSFFPHLDKEDVICRLNWPMG